MAVGLLLAVAMSACVPAGGSSDDDAPSVDSMRLVYKKGVLQPLSDGFPKSPLTIVSVDEPGSRDGLYARVLKKALKDISPVDVVVSDEPRANGGTVDTMLDVQRRTGGDAGYFPIVSSILGTSTDFHSTPYERDMGVSLNDLDFFIATETYPYVLAQRAGAPWGDDFASFVDYGRKNPGKIRYVSGGVGSGVDVTMSWLMSELKIEVKKIPAADRTAAMSAIGAGAGDVTLTQPEVALPAEQKGRAVVTFVSTKEVPSVWKDKNVASAADYEKYGVSQSDWGTIEGLLLPAKVPDSHTAWLYELFKKASETDVYKERGTTQPGIGLKLYDGTEANAAAKTLYKLSLPIIKDLGLYWGDQ